MWAYLISKHISRRALLWVILASSLSMLGACFQPYTTEIQQGNVLDDQEVARLRVGMSRQEVRFRLGTPLIEDPFHANRWDYYSNRIHADTKHTHQILSLFFEENSLVRIQYTDEN